MYLDIARAVENFANSAGCMLNDPTLNHAFAPFTSFPKIKTAINSKSDPP
jgi:hypothetical protein